MVITSNVVNHIGCESNTLLYMRIPVCGKTMNDDDDDDDDRKLFLEKVVSTVNSARF